MNYELIVRPEAECDLNEAFDWYERQVDGLGREFLICIEAGLATIRHEPFLLSEIYQQVRRLLIRRFPFGIFYRVNSNRISVLAILHCSRHAKTWQMRI